MPAPVTAGLLEAFSYGLGYQDFIPLANPAAGANQSFTVDSRNWLRVLGARATLTTDANAANRLLSLDYITGRTQTYLRNQPPVVITAGTTNQAFEWKEQLTGSEWNTNTPVHTPVSSIFLAPGTVIQFTVTNVQVGDQLSGLSLTVERFDTGPSGYPVGFLADLPAVLAALRLDDRIGPKPTERLDFPPEGT